jgi:hypothetical protein
MDRWTEEELNLLNSDMSISDLAQALQRSQKAVRKKMESLQIVGGKFQKLDDGVSRWKPWTEEELDCLKSCLSSMTVNEIAAQLNRTPGAVRKRIAELGEGIAYNPILWTKEGDDYIRANYGKLPVSKIAVTVGRTEIAVRTRARFLKVRVNPNYTYWTPEQEETLKLEYKPDKNLIKALAKKLVKSVASVKQKALKFGLCRTRQSMRYRKWEPEEVEILEELSGDIPMLLLVNKLNKFAKKQGLSPRTYNSVRLKASELKLPYLCSGDGDYFSISNIADGLRMNRHVVSGWLKNKQFAKILQPIRQSDDPGCVTYIPRTNLRKFIQQYPGEISAVNPDMLWFISLFDSK